MRAAFLFPVAFLAMSSQAQAPCDVTLTGTAITCEGTDDGTLTVVTNSGGPFTYVWDFDPAEITATVGGLAPGFYSVTVTDAVAGCDTIIDTVLVEPSVLIDGTVDYCPSDPPVLTAIGLGGLDPVDYLWSTDPNDTLPTVFIAPGTNGQITVTVTGSNGCQVDADVTVSELPSPTVAFVAPDTTCQRVLTLVNTIATTADSLVWRWAGYGFSNQVNPLIAFTGSGWQPVSLQGFDLLGCGGLPVLDSIFAQPQVPAIFTAAQVPCTPTVDIVLGSTADSCAFFIGDSLWTNDCASYFRYDNMRYDSVAFTLYATQANGCNDTLDIIIDVRTEPTLFYANSFTPNDDGINDFWPVRVDHPDLGFELKIYDRWGAQLWATEDPNEQWDGADVPNGVYVYTVRRRDPCEPTKELVDYGHLTVFR